MALNRVAARIEGDYYQSLFFWREACLLLDPNAMVRSVSLEHDEADGVDDVAVFYDEPGIEAGGWLCSADYYQVKYHVNRARQYGIEALLEVTPSHPGSSLMRRFMSAFLRLISSGAKRFRLHLVSNWSWREDDKFSRLVRESDGSLPREFFAASQSSEWGGLRERMRSHLNVDEPTLLEFCRTLRLQVDHFGRRDFEELVRARLALAGLRQPPRSKSASIYAAITQQLIMSGTNTFDRRGFRDLCAREGLFEVGRRAPAAHAFLPPQTSGQGTISLASPDGPFALRAPLQGQRRLVSDRARLVQLEMELLDSDGGVWDEAKFCATLGIEVGEMRRRVRQGRLIAIEIRQFGVRLPSWQVHRAQLLYGLEEVLAVLPPQAPLMWVQFFVCQSAYLAGQRPLDLLRKRRRLPDVLRAAHALEVHGAW